MAHRFYSTALWRARRKHQLAQHPLCEMHGARGEVVVATVAHHLQQHNGNWNIFCSSPLQSLCESCHNSVAQSLEKGGRGEMIGLDGWPIRNDFQK